MEAQLKLPIFENEKVEKFFEHNGISKQKIRCGIGNYTVTYGEISYYIRKDDEGVFIHISSLNLLGKRSGTLFRFMDKNNSNNKTPQDVIIPELAKISKERIVEFVESVIKRYNNREFVWDYEYRCNIYSQKTF